MTSEAAGLIVNADDLGLTEGVNRGIIRAHREGIVTSTSILASAAAFDDAVRRLADAPSLGVGLHLAVVGEDPPLLTAREIPTLVDRRGRLDLSWRRFVPRCAARRVDLADVEREFAAQRERAVGAGLTLTHLDSHQHVHLWPPIGRLVVGLAATWGVPAIRIPRSQARRPTGIAVGRLAHRLEAVAAAAHVGAPDRSAGLDQAGHLDLAGLMRVLPALRVGSVEVAELGTHPGEAIDPERDRFRWGYRWADELALLTSTGAREAVERGGFALVDYRALAQPGG